MKKSEKEAFVPELHARLEKAAGVFLVDYQGLNVEALNRLRNQLRENQAEFQVVKNRLLKRASDGTDAAVLQEDMRGPSAVALTAVDVAACAKILMNFSKEAKDLKIKVGQISGKPMNADGVKRLAELPGRDVLLAEMLSAMQGVPGSFVRVLHGVLTQFLYVLKAIEEQKAGA